MESTICHFEIPADDIGAAETFYSKLFGWKMKAAPKQDYFFIRTSDEHADALGGGILPRIDPKHGVTLFVTVESLDASVAKLEELGGEVVVPKTAVNKMGWTVTARDPQGNTIGLFEPDTGAAA